MKKKLLVCTEASYLSTGFSTIAAELLKRLHTSYELCEFASYGDTSNPKETRWRDLPWKFIPVVPPADTEEFREYASRPINAFGCLRFERACLEFKPDVVLTFRDPWMDAHVEASPYRPFFHWVHIPTVDAQWQTDEWIDMFKGADALFTYTDWAADILRKQGLKNVRGACPPGTDLETFKVYPDKGAHKEKMGISREAFVVGMVARNQVRKLYPDLLEAFRLFLNQASEELSRRSLLYLHTAWPDLGWNIPQLLCEFGLSHKVLFTYMCKSCGSIFPSFFQDFRGFCRSCGQPSATFANSTIGVSRHVMNEVYNLMDVYVQLASSEGIGMPQTEAAACGVPVFSVNYSGMEDIINKLGATPIPVKKFVREVNTHCFRAYPDNESFAQSLIEFAALPEPIRRQRGFTARLAAERYYNWDDSVQIIEDYVDSLGLTPKWAAPPRIHSPNLSCPQGLSPDEFVRWGMSNIAGRPDLVNSLTALKMVRNLNWGCIENSVAGGQRFQNYTMEDAARDMLRICERDNHWENLRLASNKEGK